MGGTIVCLKFCGSSFIGNGNYYGTSYDGIVRTFRWYLPPESETYALYMDRSTAVCCLYDLLYGGDLKGKRTDMAADFIQYWTILKILLADVPDFSLVPVLSCSCNAVFPGKKISGRETDRPVSGMADNPGTVIFI